MGEEHVRMLHQFVNQAKGENPTAGLGDLMKKMENAVGYMNHLQNGITIMSTEVAIVRSQLNMLMRMLVDAGLLTKEEIDKRYEEEVAKPMKEQFAKMQQQAQQEETIKGAMDNDKKV